jgi:hypothetical protein
MVERLLNGELEFFRSARSWPSCNVLTFVWRDWEKARK